MDIKWVVAIAFAIIVVLVGTAFSLRELYPGSDFDTALIVNGEKISMQEVRSAYLKYVPPTVMTDDEIMDVVVDSIINYRLLLQDAERKGITVSDEEIEQIIANTLAGSGLTEEQIATASGMEVLELRTKIRNDLTVNRLLLTLFEGTEVSQQEVNALYERNIVAFMVPQYVSVRQIFFDINKHSNEEIAQLATSAVERLKSEDFCQVANELSDDEEKCRVYNIQRGTLFAEYEQAAFGQAIGAASLVQSDQGIHIVQTVNRLNFNPVPLARINESIAYELKTARRQEAYLTHLNSLRESANIKDFVRG